MCINDKKTNDNLLTALEEVIGEYVLNIDKENLKIAALRGKIKLENVQLDGDVLGSHILGSIGLSGFGILSCYAKTVIISIPLQNLEKEATKIEMIGCHLLCLPLLPATAHQSFGAGNYVDPRCTLRTRAKRAKLFRFEKNYLQGRIPGEGPVARRILRAVKEVQRDQQKKQRRLSRGKRKKKQQQLGHSNNSLFGSTATTTSLTTSNNSITTTGDGNDTSENSIGEIDASSDFDMADFDSDDDDDDDDDDTSPTNSSIDDEKYYERRRTVPQHHQFQESASGLYNDSIYEDEEEKSSKDPSMMQDSTTTTTTSTSSTNSSDLPSVPRDWKVKLREKVMRNMEASMHDIHVRCEVFEGGLDFCHPDYRNPHKRKQSDDNRRNNNNNNSNNRKSTEYDQRAFAFGATLDSFVMRTANEKWEVGSHEKTKETKEKDHLGPNPYHAKNNKLHTWKNFSAYWDDDPAFLISESEIIRIGGTKIKL